MALGDGPEGGIVGTHFQDPPKVWGKMKKKKIPLWNINSLHATVAFVPAVIELDKPQFSSSRHS